MFACMLAVAAAAPGVLLTSGRQFAYSSPLAYAGAPLAYGAPLAASPLSYAAASPYSGITYNAGILKPTYTYSGLPAYL